MSTSVRHEICASREGYRQALSFGEIRCRSTTRGRMPDMPLSTAAGGNVSWMRFLDRPAPSRVIADRQPILSLRHRSNCRAHAAPECAPDDVASVKHLIPEKGLLMRRLWKTRGRCLGDRRARGAGNRDASRASEPIASNPAGPSEFGGLASPLGFTPRSRPRTAQGRGACAGRADAGECAELAARLDRRAARRRHAGRLQDGRFRSRQAARMGLEGRYRRAGGPAQLSQMASRRRGSRSSGPSPRSFRWTKRRSRPTRIPRAAPPLVHSMATASRARHPDRSST